MDQLRFIQIPLMQQAQLFIGLNRRNRGVVLQYVEQMTQQGQQEFMDEVDRLIEVVRDERAVGAGLGIQRPVPAQEDALMAQRLIDDPIRIQRELQHYDIMMAQFVAANEPA